MALNLLPISLRDANQFVTDKHRHHKAPQGHKFSIAATDGNGICGVVIAGRPVARMLDDGRTLEVTRCCTDGTKNACSMLYRAVWRAAKAMGYSRLITYTLPHEGGASLRGAGWTLAGNAGGGSWNRPSRARVDKHPTSPKVRWEITSDPVKALREDG